MENSNIKTTIGYSGNINWFWGCMGPLLTSKKISKAVGDNIYDCANTVWFIVHYKNFEVIGFCCAEILKTKIMLRHTYVVEKLRGLGLGGRVEKERDLYLKINSELPQEVVIKEAHRVDWYRKRLDFNIHGKRGAFTVLRKDYNR